jgi:hypothetical protein
MNPKQIGLNNMTQDSTFESWMDWYTDRFSRISNDSLKGYWYAYGRDTEDNASPRDLAAWAAVNNAMQQRQL